MTNDIEKQVIAALAPYDLADAYSWFVARNPSNNLPYHNLFHAECMVINCAKGANELRLSPDNTKALLLAAIFHDFAHSGGEQSDDDNIELAIGGLGAYCTNSGITQDCREKAASSIRATRFPYITKAETLSQKIIRDADQMQMYMPGWKEQIFTGLRKEIGVAAKKELSLQDMIRLQIEFMENIRWETSWAEQRAKTEWPDLIEQVKQMGRDCGLRI